ncbi:class I SAM-dependent methyltransferase [Candidatus Falkowbacteria bacterium]|nr:class I SAM-dependent methyltransferase [Candidatus Falkowbacteria bacterium]
MYNEDSSMDPGFSAAKTAMILDWIGSGKKVLDVGCYDGRDSERIMNNNNEVYGIEIMPAAAAEAERRGIKVSAIDLEKDSWPYQPDFFDGVVAGDIIEHMVDTDRFLTNIHRCLKPGGLLIVATPNLASFGRRLMLLFGRNPFIEVSSQAEVNHFPPVGHVKYFVKKSLVDLLEYYGFAVDTVTTDGLHLFFFTSLLLGKLFPSFGWRFIVKAHKR